MRKNGKTMTDLEEPVEKGKNNNGVHPLETLAIFTMILVLGVELTMT